MESQENTTIEKVDLRDNSKRAKLAINIFWAICIMNLIAIFSGYLEYEMLVNIKNVEFVSDEETLANDLRQGIVGIIQTGFYIASMVLFLNWFRRAYGNLHRLRLNRLEYTESMAVWSFCIPFVNLFRPYKIAREIAVETQANLKAIISDYRASSAIPIVGLWWTLFILTGIVGNIALKTIFKDDTIEQLITSTQAYMISDLLDIPAALVTLVMIKQISKEEALLLEYT